MRSPDEISNISESVPPAESVLTRGALVVVKRDPRGLARTDRVLDADRLRIFFFATGTFDVVATNQVTLAPVGTGAPAHQDYLQSSS